MRNIFIVCVLQFVLVPAFSQSRDIKMPNEHLTNIVNIAEKKSGYWCSIDFEGGSTLMEKSKNLAMSGVNFTNGYRFNQYLKAGIGIGALYYINNDNVRSRERALAMPLYINVRGNILSDEIRKNVPFWSVNVGTTLSDGFFLTSGVGLRIGEMRSAFTIGLNYMLRNIDSQPGKHDYYSGASVKIGYEF